MILLWNSAAMEVMLDIVTDAGRSQYRWAANRMLARDMLGYLRDRLAEHGATFADITAIGVFRGPGSYTGLRIGMAVLNTLARGLHIPIVGAVGNDWREQCLARIARNETDRVVLPDYGGEAHTTKPRK